MAIILFAILFAAVCLLRYVDGARFFHGAHLSPSSSSAFAPTTATLDISVIDVGQGDAILVAFPNGAVMLVDAGDRDHGGAVTAYLRERKVRRIDLLVATHPHEDHIGGMEAVMAAFPVEKVWDSGYPHGTETQQDFLRTIRSRGIRFGTPRRGVQQQFGKVTVSVLAPRRLLSGTDSDANNNSLVLLVSYGSFRCLLTGDMELDERNDGGRWPRCTVLKVAHHGSTNGTDRSFLRAVQPKVAVISCAAKNPYGHPHPAVLSLLRSIQADTRITAVDGTVLIRTDGRDYTVQSTHTAPATAIPATTKIDGSFIGNRRSHVFHLTTCANLPAERNRVRFGTRAEAEREGYRPCGGCRP